MFFRCSPEPDRAVDACAGVPAGVRLVGVEGTHFDRVFPLPYKRLQVNIEVRIAVRTERCFFTVHVHFGFAVNAFEFQQQCAFQVLFGQCECFGISVVRAFEPADVQSSHGLRSTRFPKHRVVGDTNRNAFAFLSEMSDLPSIVKILVYHGTSVRSSG